MENDLVNKTEKSFESIKYTDENGVEFWYARELMIVLEYKQWRRFEQVIEKAKEACKNSNINIDDHFADVGKIVKAGSTSKDIGDIKLTRYACITHHNVGQAVRQTIKRIGGTMPEDLPTPSKSAKQIEKEKQKELKSNDKKRLK